MLFTQQCTSPHPPCTSAPSLGCLSHTHLVKQPDCSPGWFLHQGPSMLNEQLPMLQTYPNPHLVIFCYKLPDKHHETCAYSLTEAEAQRYITALFSISAALCMHTSHHIGAPWSHTPIPREEMGCNSEPTLTAIKYTYFPSTRNTDRLHLGSLVEWRI